MSTSLAEPEGGGAAQALERLRAWRHASGRRANSVPVPAVFLRDPYGGDPPLARMIRAGRSDVRLGVYLCLLLRATQEPHDVRNNPTPAAWAEMLCLADPKRKGARRVTAAFKWLESQKLVALRPRAGRTPVVELLDPAGSGQPFDAGAQWVAVPQELWLRGWIFELRETSLAVLLVLLDLLYGAKSARFVTPERRESYGLSEDTWTRGVRDLRDRGLLTVGRIPIGDDFHFDRLRNTYWIDPLALDDYPAGVTRLRELSDPLP